MSILLNQILIFIVFNLPVNRFLYFLLIYLILSLFILSYLFLYIIILYFNIMDSKTLSILITVSTIASLLFYNTNLLNQQNTLLSDFQNWKLKHHINYQSQFENAFRSKIFLQNKAKILQHNSKQDKTYQLGLNQFSALTHQEFVQTYLGLITQKSQIKVQNQHNQIPNNLGDVDWTSQGAVTDIKDQGQCGSCWAFSTTGSLEGLSKIAYGQLKSFSQQQLVDCSFSYGNYGCNGGLMNSAFKFIVDNGIALQNEYPYKGIDEKCKKPKGDFKISGYVSVKSCPQLAVAIQQRPVSVAVDATNWSMYSSGIFNNCNNMLNHGVLLVGVNDQYWRIKNSWGKTWGQSGFIRLAKGNTCGVCDDSSYPKK